jgi:hypothetical protein
MKKPSSPPSLSSKVGGTNNGTGAAVNDDVSGSDSHDIKTNSSGDRVGDGDDRWWCWKTFASLEIPMANLTLAMTIISLIWKSPIGLGWLPFGLGPAFLQITETRGPSSLFSSSGGDIVDYHTRPPQYPRRVSDGVGGDDNFWNLVYFCMYGLLGFWAQYGGRKLSQGQPLVRWSLLYGTFHMILAGHHIMWAVTRMMMDSDTTTGGSHSNYGKLELWRYNLPGLYVVTASTSLIMLYQSGRIISMVLVSSGSSRGRRGTKGRLSYMHLIKIRRIKTIFDTCSVWTLFAFLFFWVFNLVDYDAPMIVDRILWAATMYPLPFLASAAFLA